MATHIYSTISGFQAEICMDFHYKWAVCNVRTGVHMLSVSKLLPVQIADTATENYSNHRKQTYRHLLNMHKHETRTDNQK